MDKLSKIEDIVHKVFDYIIIGGGTCGSTLAARLSENPKISVLVLEAGKLHDNDPLIDIPTGVSRQFGNPDYDWAFQTTPQKRLYGKSVMWNRGKGLGGSSNMNYLAWNRPGKDDIDAWERLGNPGWSYNQFMPYVKKAEKFHCPPEHVIQRESLSIEQSWYGKEGNISVSFPDMLYGAEPVIRATLSNCNIPNVKDPANGYYCGTWCSPATVDPANLARSTAFKGYLQPIMGRPNLSILTEAYVNKILLDDNEADELISAKGVEFSYGHKTYVITTIKEVLLCAGAIKSPQILELSGIGDPEVLTPLEIDVRLNLPGVGTNMQDHVSSVAMFELKSDVNIHTLDMLSNPTEYQEFFELYQQKQGGLLAFTVSGLTFPSLQSISSEANEIITKLEKRLADDPCPPGTREQYKIQLERLKNPQLSDVEIITTPVFMGPNRAEPGERYISLVCAVVKPWSRGTAHIVSKDPSTNPALDANYFAEEVDLDIIAKTVKFAKSLGTVEPFKDVILKEVHPGPTVNTDDEVKEQIRQHQVRTLWPSIPDASSTLSMLPREHGGVVDPSLKVWGTKNIRVCDISIVPLQIGLHTQAMVYGIAERAAEIILSHTNHHYP